MPASIWSPGLEWLKATDATNISGAFCLLEIGYILNQIILQSKIIL